MFDFTIKLIVRRKAGKLQYVISSCDSKVDLCSFFKETKTKQKNEKYENQYFVGKPFASIIALHLRGMLLERNHPQ